VRQRLANPVPLLSTSREVPGIVFHVGVGLHLEQRQARGGEHAIAFRSFIQSF
jgi:hypothetical protein